MSDSTITVLGAGYVGLSTAALFANVGKVVYLVEPNKNRLDIIKSGKSFFYEDGLDNLIRHALDSNTLIPTDSYSESIPNSSVIFSCVGTPDNPDGSSNLSYVLQSATETSKYIVDNSIFVQKSTVPVGTGGKIKRIFTSTNTPYISNPEFLRESTAIFDTLFFDRVVIGGDDYSAIERVRKLYKELESVKSKIAYIAQINYIDEQIKSGQYITTDLNSAELIKVTSNAFLALKISFANSIAILADKAGGDINDIMDAVGADKRIGKQFLHAGRGYGGGCFPKDIAGLIARASDYDINLSIMQSAQEVNNSMVGYIVNKLRSSIGGSIADKNIAVLGTAFKAETSDIRQSPGIKMASLLLDLGANLSIYDPQALEETREYFGDTESKPSFCNSLSEAIMNSDAVIIATEWKEFLEYDLNLYKKQMSGRIFVDAVNSFDSSLVKSSDLHYIGVGRR